jgi:hypothetical protein
MINQYHYIVSSLPDLSFRNLGKVPALSEFLDFCTEMLSPSDLAEVRKVFIFNDATNIIALRAGKAEFVQPSFLDWEQLQQSFVNPPESMAFLAEFLDLQQQEKRAFPSLVELDELITLLYQNLDTLSENAFLRRYFLLVLDLKNTALHASLKHLGLNSDHALIPIGEAHERIVKSLPPDSGHIPMLEKLFELIALGDLHGSEQVLEDIQWLWLEEETANAPFSLEAIMSYAIRLMAVERWQSLTPAKGRQVLDQLSETIKNGVQFSDEFLKTEDRK